MAALIQRRGIYYAQFDDNNRVPSRKRFSLRTKKKRTARKLLANLEDDYIADRFDPWTDDPWSYDEDPFEQASLKQALKRFIQRKQQAGCTSNTLRTYRECVGLLIQRVGSELSLEQLTATPLRSFIRRSDLAPATQLKRYGHLSTFLSWCEQEGYLRSNPLDSVERPQPPKKLPKAITREELQQLTDTLKADYQEKRSHNWIRKGQLIWRIPLFWFAFYTGMRGEELARLRWQDIDKDKDLIYIRKQKNNKEQTIPLNRKAKEVLEGIEDGPANTYVFQSPKGDPQERQARWFRENVSTAFRKARKAAGLREELSFHSLRHGFCTMLAEAGKSAVVIKEAARHADISTSMRYVHMANERLKAELDEVFG